MSFKPTPEQVAIVDFAKNETRNLAVVARAGAAKTTTLILLAEALPDTQILCLAFNKKIAEEMTARLPRNATAKTLHGLGFGVWQRFLGKKLKVNSRKNYKLLRDRIEKLPQEEKELAFESMSETLDFISTGKAQGWVPESCSGHWKPLVTDADFFAGLPMEPNQLQEQLIIEVSSDSWKLSLESEIDFDDMILCPALCQVSWPTYPLVLVDEAQDLSSLNHYIVKKLVKRNRLIAVGDPCQAIYGFRGADESSMKNMQEKFNMETLYLTISFRCARSITENARWRAADMRAPDWAEEGSVETLAEWGEADLQDGDAIICRNNAPLFSMAIRLIKAGRLPEIAGRDVGAPVLKLMKKLGKPGQLSLAAIDAVNQWEERETKRARAGARALIKDKAEIIRIMLKQTKTLGDAIAYFEHLLHRSGRIYLMTGHKSKGLEFDNVWFLNPDLIRAERDQDANIKYVIETRAKKNLRYVQSSLFSDNDEQN